MTDEQFVHDAIATIPTPDEAWEPRAWARLDSLTKPPVRSASSSRSRSASPSSKTENPSLARKAIVFMAADHGVVAQGVSAFPPRSRPAWS